LANEINQFILVRTLELHVQSHGVWDIQIQLCGCAD